MAVIKWGKEGSVAVLSMDNGENRHNPVFIREILAAFDEIEVDTSVNALVIASTDEKNWSQGIDINWILPALSEKRMDEVRGFLYGINDLFKRILQFPVPVIAAINGHTFGNGSIMACACDFRFMKSQRGYFCFPEVDINIPFLPGMLAIIRKAFPLYKMEEAIFTGKRMTAVELEEAKVIFKACADDETLMKEAMEFAGTFAKDHFVFGTIKKRYNNPIVKVIETEDPPCIEDFEG